MGFWRKEQISFFLTSRCNLACNYCYIPKIRVRPDWTSLNLDFAAVGLRDFFASSSSRTLRFFGAGEPTLAIQAMKSITHTARKMAPESRVWIELETNGHFSQEVADWIETNVDYLWISCDGLPAIQDAQRPRMDGGRSSDAVLANIRRFANTAGLQFGVRATLSSHQVDRQCQLIEFFHSLGVRHVAASPAYRSPSNSLVPKPDLYSFAKHFVEAYHLALEYGISYQTLMTVNFDEEVETYCQACKPTPRLTTDGYVSCCDWASFGPEVLPGSPQELIYGRYDPSTKSIIYDNDKITRIRRRNVSFLRNGPCAGCEALRHCAGGCIGKMMAETNCLYRPFENWCAAVRHLFRHLPRRTGLFPVLHP